MNSKKTAGIKSIVKSKIFILLVAFALLLVMIRLLMPVSPKNEKQPLYWVAPMDPNYRRDAPGKSPMGMDLVPVYQEPKGEEPGVVQLSGELQQQMAVRKTEVIRGSLKQHIRAFGRVTFDQSLIVKLSPRVTGWVDELFVSVEGEAVQRGQALYSLYSKELIHAQERFLQVYFKGEQQNILRAESELKALNMDDRAIRQLKDQGVAQRSVVFRAQQDGVIGMLNIGKDYFVEPGDLLMAIGSLERVWLELEIFESQASHIKNGQLLSFTTAAYPDLMWEGEVDYIYPALQNQTRSLLFRSRIDNPMMRLRPNMQVQALIELAERETALLVPHQAVIRLGDQDRVVLDMGDGRFKSVAVQLGQSNGKQVEVVEGLAEGDIVVSSAHFLIDSESSKSSDFLRYATLQDSRLKYPPTWVKAKILEISFEDQEIRLKHDYIEAWKMPSMTMNFSFSDDLDFASVAVGQEVRVKVTDGDPLFKVIAIEASSGQ